jgi:hypothetical protein
MQDEVKITVIATGFGQRVTSRIDFETMREPEPVARPSEMPRPDLGAEELDDINIPAFLRNRV